MHGCGCGERGTGDIHSSPAPTDRQEETEAGTPPFPLPPILAHPLPFPSLHSPSTLAPWCVLSITTFIYDTSHPRPSSVPEEADLDVLVRLLQLVGKLQGKPRVLHRERVEPGGRPELQLDDDILAVTPLELLDAELGGVGSLAERGELVERSCLLHCVFLLTPSCATLGLTAPLPVAANASARRASRTCECSERRSALPPPAFLSSLLHPLLPLCPCLRRTSKTLPACSSSCPSPPSASSPRTPQ